MSKAKATSTAGSSRLKDPIPALEQACKRADALHTEISSTGLFNLVWSGKWPDFKPNNRFDHFEVDLNRSSDVLAEADSYFQMLEQACIRLNKANATLSVLIGKKLQQEFDDIDWDINGRFLTDEEHEMMYKSTIVCKNFDDLLIKMAEICQAADELAENAKRASAETRAAQMNSSYFAKNKDQMENVQKLFEEKLRQKKEEIRRLEEEKKAKAREERERREREARQRKEQERLEREEMDREQREREEREKEASEQKAREEKERREQEEREREERERAERERRQREKRERKERERLEREERERQERERLEKEKQERLEREKREKEERERRDPNSKFWRSLLYNAQEETKQNKGLHCVFRAFTDSLVRSEMTVVEVPFLKAQVPIGSGEELASTVLDITSENGRLEYPYAARLAMPNLVGRHHFYSAIAKIRVDDSREWTTVPSKDTNIDKYKDLGECELPPFTSIRVAIFRAVPKDAKVIRRGGGTVRSHAEPRISIEFPKDAVQDPREITLLVRNVDHQLIESLKRHSQGCENVTTASHVLHVENMEGFGRFKAPLKITMPAVERLLKTKKKQDKTSPLYTMVVQLGLNGQWSICQKVDAEPNEEGVVTVLSSNPLAGMVVMGMAINSEAKAEFSAERLDQHLDEHVIRFLQRQSEKDRSQIVTDCVNTEDSDKLLEDLNKKGFTEGPIESKEILIREGQKFTMMLSQWGNIRRTGFGKVPADGAIEFVYHSKIKCSRAQFSVEPDNIYGQSSRDYYFGNNEYFTQNNIGRPDKKIHDFGIKLPRMSREKSTVHKAPRRFGAGALGEEVFRLIGQSLEDEEWTQLATRLKMDKAKIARIERDNSGKGLDDTVFAILWDWYKKTEVSGNKVDNLCRSLRKLNKEDLAYHIEQENNKILEEQKKSAKETNLNKAFFIVKESETVLRSWKMIGHRLGVPDCDVAAIDIDVDDEVDGVKEKVWKLLNAWKDQETGGATIDKLISVMRKMKIGLVADKLGKLIPVSDQNRTVSQPTPARSLRPKTAGPSNSGLSPRGLVSRPSTVHAGSRR
ncbi:uncharacterized protein LOC135494612 [Lineus longissimus]|uniref:uncharacterized protein LOC135494612 n=1 Tax=Lineus longissimus TaxID=88925 RepID=UPI002B4E7486